MLKSTVSKFKLKKNAKTIGKLDDLRPEILKMLENMSQKDKVNQENFDETFSVKEEAPTKTKIELSDKEFGKY